jgi:uncharacterized protein (UPF0332 family)
VTDVAAALLAKANVALASATLLLRAGDIDGACNRGYYAMFDAARAALIQVQTDSEAVIAKTHSGLIAAFGLQLVKAGHLPVELGRLLNRAEEVRLIADYRGESVEHVDASRLLADAGTFVSAMREFLQSKQ